MNVWITGASSGIGEACARRYARKGCQLILTSSSSEKLIAVAKECRALGAADVFALPFDFSSPYGIEGLAEQAWNAFGNIDVLFCNAGVSQRTTVEDTSMDMVRKIMEINYFAPVAITKAILPLMLESGGGKIAVTTSIAAKFGFPLRCGYSASKHALDGFFETLQAEYSDRGISVTLVCPGRVQTNISLNALDKGGVKYGKMDPGQAGGITADKAAETILDAIDKGKREVLVGGKELLMVYVKRFFPGLCAKLGKKVSAV